MNENEVVTPTTGVVTNDVYTSINMPNTNHIYNYRKEDQLSYIFLSELIGMFVFIYGSISSVNYYVLTAMSYSGAVDNWAVAFCFGVSLTCGIILAKYSGGHLNPCVSFAMWVVGSNISFSQFLVYTLAQGIGSIIAALLVIAQYSSWINNFENYEDNLGLVGMYGTLKNTNVSLVSSIVDQFIGSFILMFAIVYIPNSNKQKPLLVGFTLMALGVLMQSNGFAFNAWRDMGPRIVSTILFKSLPFDAMDHWFWVPLTVPFPAMVIAKLVADHYSSI